MTGLVFSTHRAAAVFGRPVAGTAEGLRPSAGPPAALPDSVFSLDARLNGPRRSANGGFAAGTIARHVDADVVTVVLRRPIPLRRLLVARRDGGGGILIHAGRRVVAEARPGALAETGIPAPPSFNEALAARDAHPLAGLRHPLSDCVVCGPRRADGMHVTPGFAPGRPELLAAPWIVGSRDSVGGAAPFPAVWAAMDCASYPAAALRDRELCLLGTMTAEVERRPRVGEQLVVHSWTRAHEGRRYETSVALTDAAGEIVARADATWIALRHQGLHALRMRRGHGARVPY
ncbi:hotdog family protein [Microbacterium gallinarum]|jgi:hypothetical protein|uniref:Thioesterase family protein n=1 Tax=Microbacterium gallinarum TaxID=2762209 RepID=A0ABR8X5E6_9MICO|nr:hypothetical protein [Microbacterium gallinarum]MBD8024556.1 hypothetical protein [Microbacterium gallinarum]